MQPALSAEIVAVGSELLTADRTDTNSLYLTARLNEIGIEVRAKSVVGDDAGTLAARLRHAMERTNLVITTGGLGPTADDITREVVADLLGLALVEDPSVVDSIRRRFERRGLVMPDANRRQAAVPVGARLLPNPHGSAPGLWIESGSHVIVLLPGPPREMQPMFAEHVLPHLAARAPGRRLLRRVLKIAGRAESEVEEIAAPHFRQLAAGPIPLETTILASPGQVELHLSARGSDEDAMARALDAGVDALTGGLGAAVFSSDGRSIERVVGDELAARHWRVAVAESCTGGLVSGRLTEVPGSSAWFAGGIVAYADEVKVRDLGVPAETIARDGAVSESVARAMAQQVRRRFGTEIGVGVTGTAGPGGGSPEKPVGTVAIAVDAESTRAHVYRFNGDRSFVRAQAVMSALELVRQVLLASPVGSARGPNL